MSRESLNWLNTNTLVGFTDKRGTAWHWRAEQHGEQSNHYPEPTRRRPNSSVPVAGREQTARCRGACSYHRVDPFPPGPAEPERPISNRDAGAARNLARVAARTPFGRTGSPLLAIEERPPLWHARLPGGCGVVGVRAAVRGVRS